MSKNKFTPATIDRLFSIPLYQRLFEWDDVQIIQLLNDLYSSFEKDSTAPYYIGMLTSYKGNDERYSLVDGQQRFTVLMLMGIVFKWTNFLKNENEAIRLTFFARKKDEKYLKALIDNEDYSYSNRKIKAAISCLENFLSTKPDNRKEDFKKYVHEQTTFFISDLPTKYSLQDLNRYFEAMNEAGKGLENHEILKVRLLKQVNPDKRYECTAIWNSVSEMDKCLIRQGENERQEDYKNRNLAAFRNSSFDNILGQDYKTMDDPKKSGHLSIKDIQPTSRKPQGTIRETGERAILTFTDYLLQVLWLCQTENKRSNSTDFFNRNKLLSTFDIHIKQLNPFKEDGEIEQLACVDIDDFFRSLLIYRLLFDYHVIRQNSKDQGSITYSLNQVAEDKNEEVKRCHIQYQSMVFVSTETYIWLTPFLEQVNENRQISIKDSLAYLQSWDNKRQSKTEVSLNYQSIGRYWFWRLDYYLWLNRTDYFSNELQRKIAGNYIFRANRSIEHIAPQQPKSESTIVLEHQYLHRFGNLAMISSGQNSSLQNESFEVKRAHVESFVNESVGGSIQSLKMLKIYEFNTWNKKKLIKHHNEMVEILIDSFGTDHEYLESIKQLKAELFQFEFEDDKTI
ncbi:MAG: DUF262 domain-containing protein [Chitinophagaceae bacterium]|nr:DUF262 domain-containing protein [Chitinophagaceae bacterium]